MKKFYLFLLGITLLGAFLRVIFLSNVPPGFNQDESSIGYNAYSILKTGKDEYGKNYPVYFKAFGDQKLPVYIYATSVSESLFGVNEFAVRFPSAFFGILSLPVFGILVLKLTKRKDLALLAAFFMAVNPWSLHYNRSAYEVSISLFLFLSGTLSLYYSLVEKKRGGFFLGTLLFLLSLYSYNLTRLLSPILYIFVLWWFGQKSRRFPKVEIGATLIGAGILLIPFIVSFFSSSGVNSAGGTLIFSSARFHAPLLEFRATLVSLPPLLSKAFFNMPFLILWEYVRNVASYLSVPFLFLVGENHGNHGIGNVGQFYLFELPLMIVGAWYIVKAKDRAGYFFLIWGLIAILVASLTREAPQATRSFFLIVTGCYLSAQGLLLLYEKAKSWSLPFRVGIALVIVLFAGYSMLYYFASYYYQFPISYAKAWRSADKEVAYFIRDNDKKYDRIIFSDDSGYSYASLLFFSQYDPASFQDTVVRLRDDSEGFSKVIKFGKVRFEKVSPEKLPSRTLVISSPSSVAPGLKTVKTVYYPEKTVVSADGQRLLQYPHREEAYVISEK